MILEYQKKNIMFLDLLINNYIRKGILNVKQKKEGMNEKEVEFHISLCTITNWITHTRNIFTILSFHFLFSFLVYQLFSIYFIIIQIFNKNNNKIWFVFVLMRVVSVSRSFSFKCYLKVCVNDIVCCIVAQVYLRIKRTS